MGIISIDKANHLFWLGRYTERVFTTLSLFFDVYDSMVDDDIEAYRKYCERMGIPDIYDSEDHFIKSYVSDKTNPDSIITSIIHACDNGIVLRDEISSVTLSYLQMALERFERYSSERFTLYHYQSIIDMLYAFWGSADDCVESEECRNIMKCGKYMERLDIYMRMQMPFQRIEKEFSKLSNRMAKSGIPRREDAYAELSDILCLEEQWSNQAAAAVNSLENLFCL